LDDIVMVQAPTPEHAPDHPLKTALAEAAAVSVTCALDANDAVHAAPGQLMPEGEEVTEPGPLTTTDRLGWAVVLKVAVTAASAFRVKVHGPCAALQSPPDHPTKLELLPGAAVRTTALPCAKGAEHVVPPFPQLMPPGTDVTLPAPLTVTESVFCSEPAVTVTVADPVTVPLAPWVVAWSVPLPALRPVTFPVTSTLKTAGAPEVHEKETPGTGFPAESKPVAPN
jgi:hypothetical protein